MQALLLLTLQFCVSLALWIFRSSCSENVITRTLTQESFVPDFSFESAALDEGLLPCGVDEAGRGPWAGPVVAAAVILDTNHIPSGLNDSKKLTEVKREALFDPIFSMADVGVGIASVEEIDQLNILQANHLAMQRAVAALKARPTLALVDGNRAPPLSIRVQTIIKGDSKSLSIAAASIIAKVTRDRIMVTLDAVHPGYGFAQHKGYGTAAHSQALQRLGPCAIHRKSFAPIAQLTMFSDHDSHGVTEDS
jgi:ribonuclease HII